MVDKINIGDGQPVGRIRAPRTPRVREKSVRESFDAVIKKEIEKWEGVRFSAHALQRLNARNIKLSEGDKAKIVDAIDRAQTKGAKDSLVLIGEAALVVSISNRTVITVLDREEMRGNVFTNIDSAVVMDGEPDDA